MPRDYILTYTGRKFYPMNPRPEDIDIRDVAMGLSHICRFSGQLPVTYSVATHSVHVADILLNPPPNKYFGKQDIRIVKAGLLHDASEAFIGDVPSPLKHQLPQYNRVEKLIQRAVYERFGVDLDPDSEEYKNTVGIADLIALKTEFRDLKREPFMAEEYIPADFREAKPMKTVEEARAWFLNKFVELFS